MRSFDVELSLHFSFHLSAPSKNRIRRLNDHEFYNWTGIQKSLHFWIPWGKSETEKRKLMIILWSRPKESSTKKHFLMHFALRWYVSLCLYTLGWILLYITGQLLRIVLQLIYFVWEKEQVNLLLISPISVWWWRKKDHNCVLVSKVFVLSSLRTPHLEHLTKEKVKRQGKKET